nr:PBECR4 domain-containing protein [Fructobacillus parabroussonetiae]
MKEIVDNYERDYHGHTVEITTNFKPLQKVRINFDILDIPHLLGFQYLSKHRSASKVIELIKSGKLTIADVKKDSSFGDRIKDRLKYHHFLNEVFKGNSSQLMVITRDIRPPRLGNVEFLIYDYLDERKRKMVLIGFSPNNLGYYVPATLHVRKTPNVFTERRLTEIKSMKWIR